MVVIALITMFFLLGDWLGLVADRETMLLEERKILGETLALQVSKDVRSGKLSRIESTIRSAVDQYSQIESAVFTSEVLSVDVSPKLGGKQAAESNKPLASTDSLVIVPVFDGETRFGSIEVRFDPARMGGRAAMSNYSVAVLLFFFAAIGFLFHRLFIGRAAKEPGVAAVIPKRVRQAFDSLAEGVLVLDEVGRIAHVNKAFRQGSNLLDTMLVGSWLHDLGWKAYGSEQATPEADLPWVKVIRTGDPVLGEKMTLQTNTPSEKSYTVNCTPLDEDAEGYRGVIVTLDDLTDLQKRNESLRKSLTDLEQTKSDVDLKNKELQVLATRDSLTNCLNRRSFTENYNAIFEAAMETESSLVCIMVDIDHFKRINDNYGHAVGDKVIQFVAGVLEKQMRRDDLLGRYGGEEFCIVLESSSQDEALAAAERMRKEIASGDPSLFSSALRTTASFGVACLTSDANGAPELIHRADKALYLAKESGRNKVMVWENQSQKQVLKTGVVEGDFSVEASNDSVVAFGHFPDINHSDREWQLETIAEDYSPLLDEFTIHDALMGFGAKSLFVDRVQQALLLAKREARVIAVLSLGVSFELVSGEPLDVKSRETALKITLAQLRDKLRNSDAISLFPCSDLAADIPTMCDAELGVLLPSILDGETVAWVAKRIQDTLSEPLHVGGNDVSVTSSIGITVCPGDAEDGESLIRNACTARYFAQSRSEDSCIEYYAAHLNTIFRDKMQLENEMCSALENGEFEILYQPKIDMRSGEISGFESLLRWNHPRKGVLTPNEFLDIADRTRLINLIGDWVLRQSCRQIGEFSQEFSRELSCAINLSAVQLAQPDLVDQVVRAAKDEGFNTQRLELELTEDCLQGGLGKCYGKLAELQSHGISISIDDFGAGCSGLNYLRNLPVDVLKVDRCFVADMMENEHDVAIVSAIVSMASTLGLRVVAEGVESKEQFQLLSDLECSEAQGYFFGRPVSATLAREMLSGVSEVANAG